VRSRQFAFGVEPQKLVRHLGQRLLYARLSRCPARSAELIELRFDAFDRAITLDQVHTRQRHVELCLAGVMQKHEFALRALALELAQPVKLPDAVIHVHHVVAGLQFGEIAEE
jgi:hypothetical protein